MSPLLEAAGFENDWGTNKNSTRMLQKPYKTALSVVSTRFPLNKTLHPQNTTKT